MARCSAAAFAQATNTTLPAASLYAIAGQDLILREVGVFSTGTAAARVKIVKLTTAGTQGTGLTEANLNMANHTILGTGFNAHSVAPTLGADIDVGGIGAAAGSGFIFTFYGENNGILIPAGTANGVGVLELADTANTYDVYFIWDE